jgi:hypothetical protein
MRAPPEPLARALPHRSAMRTGVPASHRRKEEELALEVRRPRGADLRQDHQGIPLNLKTV